MGEEDDSTLSNLFKSVLRGASSLSDHSVHSYAAKRRNSKTCNALEKNLAAKGMMSSPLQSSVKGDIVWAKASPSTWWPGQVKSFKGPLISISFFGCNKTRSFNSSEVLGFEETFPRIMKMVGVKLSYEVGLALDELARNIAMGLKCCSRVSAADEDGSLAVKRRFNPPEIFRFLLDKAVSPQVFEEEIATVVRVSATLNAFRHGLVVCNTSEVDEGFCAEGVLDFVLDTAVNLCVDDKAVAQLYAFRRFTSMKPDWFYQLDWEFEEDSLESHEIEVDLELPDYTSEDELYHVRRDPNFDFSIKPHEECELQDANHKHEGREMCGINMVDLGIVDTDEKYESQIYDQCQMDADGAESAGKGIYKNTGHERIVPSFTEVASAMTEVDANEAATNVIFASLNSEPVISSPRNDPNHILQVGGEVTFNISILQSLKNATTEGNSIMPACSDKCNSVEVISSAEKLSPRTVPFYRGQLHSLPINKCSIYSPLKVLNPSIMPHSRPEFCVNTINGVLIPEMAPFAETALQISANKRKLYEPAAFENYISQQTEITAPSAHVNSVIDKALFENYKSRQNHFLNYPGQVSKPCYRRQQNHHLESNCKAFYISPLTRVGPNLPNNRLKLLVRNDHRSLSVPVLLNMKFPKNYNLPSKEQLEKKFSVFGPLDRTRTKVFFYTGVGQVVFLHQADAVVAYNYVTRKRIFGQAYVRFWFYRYENCRTSGSSIPVAVHSSLNLRPCLEKSCKPELIDSRKNCRVRFTM